MVEQNNEIFDEKSRDPLKWFYSILKSESNNISDSYLHGHSCGLDCGCGRGWAGKYEITSLKD